MMRRRVRGSLILASCILLLQLGCAVPTTDSTLALVNVAGTWSYIGSRAGQSVASSGTLALTQDRTVSFAGTFDATEQDVTGELHRVVGVVSGRTMDATTIDFDVVVDATLTRHHTGELHGDSLTGAWVELSDQGVVASGSFRARRR